MTYRLAIALFVFVLGSAAQAQDWPTKAVRIVSPFAAGGASDTVARIVADNLSERLRLLDHRLRGDDG